MKGEPDTDPMRISNDLVWYNASRLFEQCSCTIELADMISIPITQTIRPKYLRLFQQSRGLMKLNDQGPVIFGHDKNLEWRWGEVGDPIREEASLPAENTSADPQVSLQPKTAGNFQNSGIGSSAQFSPSKKQILQKFWRSQNGKSLLAYPSRHGELARMVATHQYFQVPGHDELPAQPVTLRPIEGAVAANHPPLKLQCSIQSLSWPARGGNF